MNSLATQVTALATTTVAAVTSFPHDMLVIAGVLLFFGMYAFFFGKGKTIAVILALYVASLLYTFFPMIDFIERFSLSLTLASVIIFSILLITALIALRRVFRIEYAYGKITTGIEVILLSVSASLLSVTLTQNIIPVNFFYQFSPAVTFYLTQHYIYFFALLAPLLVVCLVSMRRSYT